jgi:hypothetical protein
LAVLINLSQFFVIIGAGPVSATVIGHLKTCLIVALGWIVAGRGVTDRSLVGVILAVGSIIWYVITRPYPWVSTSCSNCVASFRLHLLIRAPGTPPSC